MQRILFIFIDGLGIPENRDNHLYRFSSIGKVLSEGHSLDAVMGVPGLPQSGTGQTSIFCGVNAQAVTGRHQYAFPDRKLRSIIKRENLFTKAVKLNRKVIFANAYTREYFEKTMARRSVSTWQVWYSTEEFLFSEHLNKGKAVYHDITNRTYPKEAEVITPEKAAENLIGICGRQDLTLFEYFLTDLIGHGRKEMHPYIEELDRFLSALFKTAECDLSIIITSDHGNIEDTSVKSHTMNRVPFFISSKIIGRTLPEDLSGIRDFLLDLLK